MRKSKFSKNKHIEKNLSQFPLFEIIKLYLMPGTRMELMPPNFTFILRQRLDNVCGEVLFTFLAWTHCVAIPKTVSPTRFTSAVVNRKERGN